MKSMNQSKARDKGGKGMKEIPSQKERAASLA